MAIKEFKCKGDIVKFECGCSGVRSVKTEGGKVVNDVVTRKADFCRRIDHKPPARLRKKPLEQPRLPGMPAAPRKTK